MYEDETEAHGRDAVSATSPFLIEFEPGVQWIHSSRIMSLAIDTGKDVNRGLAEEPGFDVGTLQEQHEFTWRFSDEEVASARVMISETTPVLKGMFSDARLSGFINTDHAGLLTEHIINAVENDAATMVGLNRLKNKDTHTFLHSLAVGALMASFGQTLGLDEAEIHVLTLGGLLHDIGKMRLPTAVLTAPRQLSAQEYADVQEHPQHGYLILQPCMSLPKPVLDICLYHHERFDGSGYPAGLIGNKIPYTARIAAICDVYEALTAARPYKQAWSNAAAIEAMMQSKGHFDPILLNHFVSKLALSGVV